MKFTTVRLLGRLQMKSLTLLFFLLGFSLISLTAWGTDSIASFDGDVGPIPPQVDATNFFNSGTWNISTTLPYETANTLNYTNIGTMNGAVGWEFDFGPSTVGQRSLSANFFNDNTGVIQANDGVIQNPISVASFDASFLLISATNIINKGSLSATANGEIVLTGTNVTLARSAIEIEPIVGIGSSNDRTNFTSDVAVYGRYWEQTNVMITSSKVWNSQNGATNIFGGSLFVGAPCGVSNLNIFTPSFAPTVSDSTNFTDPATTNIYRQAVFVNIADLAIKGQIRFFPSSISTNPIQTEVVQLSTVSTNTVTQSVETNAFFVVDTLGAETNIGLNVDTNTGDFLGDPDGCTDKRFRPANFIFSRTDNGDFARGSSGSGLPPLNFFFDTSFSNDVVQGISAAYSAFVTNIASTPISAAITNLPGKINIFADNLDLTRTRLRAEGQILIQANNLVGSAGASVDCQNLSYNLGSTNGSLNFTNLAQSQLPRLQGTVSAVSFLWTNQETMIVSTNTNTVSIIFHVLIVDAGSTNSSLSSVVPVTVQDLVLNSTNIAISDPVSISQTLLLNGRGFVLQPSGSIEVQNWNAANAPTLEFFTNNGAIFVVGDAHFGDDTATNYAAFVNNGSIFANDQVIDSSNLVLSGILQTLAGNFTAIAQSGSISGATISSAANMQLSANNMQFNSSALTTVGALNFNITNSISDSGSVSSNVFSCANGFNLNVKPATGDLPNTIFETTAPKFLSVNHLWAGEDRGPTTAGFANNAAVGRLVLFAGGDGTPSQEPQFVFSGTGAANGLYVNFLDISHLTNYNFLDGSLVSISPNLTIYFADASTNPASLNGQFGGHLVWVQGGGNNGNQNPSLSGGSFSGSNGTFQFSIASPAGKTNIIQASTNLVNWVPIMTNTGPFIFTDPNATNFPRRFYRDLMLGP